MKYILLNDDICKLSLTVRTENALKRNGVFSVGDLIMNLEKGELLNFAYLGRKGVQEIENCIKCLYAGTNGYCIANGEDNIANNEIDDAEEIESLHETNDDLPVSQLPLSKRAINCLLQAGIKTSQELYSISIEQLLCVRNLGTKTLNEIQTYIEEHPLSEVSSANITSSGEENEKDPSKKVIEELSSFLRLSPAVFKTIINENGISFLDKKCIYHLYELKPFYDALHSKMLSILEGRETGISYEAIMEMMPSHLKNTTIIKEMLLSMENSGELYVEYGNYVRQYPSIVDYITTLGNEKTKNIVLDKLNGMTLQEIGNKVGLTRERVRQLYEKTIRRLHNSGLRFREDKYALLFSRYTITKEDFTKAFDEPLSTYGYLATVTDSNLIFKKSLESILEDSEIPIEMRKRAERIVYKDYINLNGQQIHKSRPELVDYYIRTYCRELTPYDVFLIDFNNFIDALDLPEGKSFYINGRAYENRLSGEMCILWSQWRRFRFYDIQSREYDVFLEILNLKQYDGLEISTLKLFRDNPELMEEFDIHDEYELHNLLKKIWNEPNSKVSFKKMPTIEIGQVDRNAQVHSLLLQYAPISAERFGKLYEESYGVKAGTVLGSYMKDFDKYFYEGVYSIDCEDLPEHVYIALTRDMRKDYYTIQDVQSIYLHEFPGADIALINPYTLKTLGFKVYSGYVVRNTFPSAAAYFNHLLTKRDVTDMRDYPQSIQSIGAYSSELQRLRKEREIVEFSPYRYIHIRKLIQTGVTKELLDDYCQKVSMFVERNAFFTIHSIVSDGFTHQLDDLGFDEFFYASLLVEDRRHFSYQGIGGSRLYVNGMSKNVFSDMLVWLVSKAGKIDLYDLKNMLNNKYGIEVDKYKLLSIIHNTDLYYDVIMEAVYIDYDTYFEEV